MRNRKREDLTGKKFNKWTVLHFSHRGKPYSKYWVCECDCGTIRPVEGSALKSGASKSCGCWRREVMRNQTWTQTHGLSKTRLHDTWGKMIRRCEQPKDKRWERYGGRGISICDEWRNDFLAFYNWAMDNGYSDELTIDRINNDGNYEPSNCRWATAKQQSSNRSRTRFYTIDGVTKHLTDWCETYAIGYHKVWYRLKRGCTIEEALTLPDLRLHGNQINRRTRHDSTN